MAQKAAKSTAKRNSQVLNRTHLISLGVNIFFFIVRILIFRSSFNRKSLILYITLSAPALAAEALFERNSRPKYNGTELRSGGEDLEAKGLTEWMWDVLYWTWGCLVVTAIFGDRGWWLYAAVPVYSLWLAYTTFGNVRQAFGGGMPSAMAQDGSAAGTSKRQQKMEKRGNRVQYK